jgi:hypothetical protein
MSLSRDDALAIVQTSRNLGVDPGSFAGLLQLESGIDPNIWGGDGGNYRGLIQFGPGARQEVGLPDGPMTIQQQLPYVEKYYQQRGFKPGQHDETALYRTVLVGNPYDSGTDSNGTNSDSAAQRMMPGGDLYNTGLQKLNDALGGSLPSGAALTQAGYENTPASNTLRMAGEEIIKQAEPEKHSSIFGPVFAKLRSLGLGR